MMKHTIAPCAEMTTNPAPRARRRWTRTFVASFVPALVAALAACQGAPDPNADSPIGAGEQSLSADDCRSDLQICLSSAADASALGQCILDFESCFEQVALDRSGQGQLLSECRANADDCLSAAVGANDIDACGELLGACAENVVDDTRGVFPFVPRLVSRLVATSVRAVRGIIDVADALPAVALVGVRTCRDEVVTCLDAAVTDLDVSTCADSLDACVDGVVDIIDPIVDPLPGPNGSGIVASTAVCRADARDCLAGALTLSDIGACGDVLGACVDSIDDIVNQTVDDVNDIIDPLAVPKPSEVIDCTLDLVECLAALNNPFECAEQARICASP